MTTSSVSTAARVLEADLLVLGGGMAGLLGRSAVGAARGIGRAGREGRARRNRSARRVRLDGAVAGDSPVPCQTATRLSPLG